MSVNSLHVLLIQQMLTFVNKKTGKNTTTAKLGGAETHKKTIQFWHDETTLDLFLLELNCANIKHKGIQPRQVTYIIFTPNQLD